MSLLSAEASALYERLVLTGPTALAANDPALTELDNLGLTFRNSCYPGQVVAVAPDVAVERLLSAVRSEIADRHRLLDAALTELVALQREFTHARSAQPSIVEVLTTRESIMRAADEVTLGARTEALEFAAATHNADLTTVEFPVESPVRHGVRYRVVYSTQCLNSAVGRHIIALHREAGEEQRIFSGWLTSLRVADHDAALVPLTRHSTTAALLIRSRPLIVLLRQWFELIWANSTPPNQPPGAPHLTPLELEILDLQSKGHKDTAIARKLDISVRTVRRHTTNILTTLGTPTRFTAGIEAIRRGWL